MAMKTVTIPKVEYEQLKGELELLRGSKLYQRLLEFEENILKKRFTRRDLGF